MRSLLAIHDEKRDLALLGGYREGSDAAVDRAFRANADIRRFLRQAPDEVAPFDETVRELERIAARHGASAVDKRGEFPYLRRNLGGPHASPMACHSFRVRRNSDHLTVAIFARAETSSVGRATSRFQRGALGWGSTCS